MRATRKKVAASRNAAAFAGRFRLASAHCSMLRICVGCVAGKVPSHRTEHTSPPLQQPVGHCTMRGLLAEPTSRCRPPLLPLGAPPVTLCGQRRRQAAEFCSTSSGPRLRRRGTVRATSVVEGRLRRRRCPEQSVSLVGEGGQQGRGVGCPHRGKRGWPRRPQWIAGGNRVRRVHAGPLASTRRGLDAQESACAEKAFSFFRADAWRLWASDRLAFLV